MDHESESPMTQWHPIFDDLLRRALQDYYEVQTNVPVGDLPREADIVLVRRASKTRPPFRTLWKHLTRWNVLEFKGRSESARINDIDLLVEVGLGIHRRLQEQELNVKIGRPDVSFWYLANHLGKRFLRDVVELTGNLESVSPGLWQGRVLGRPLWFVSDRDVPIDGESAPVRMVSEQTDDETRQLANVLVSSDELWHAYAPMLGLLHPEMLKEFAIMAAKHGRGEINWPLFLEKLSEEIGPKELIKNVITQMSLDDLFAILTPEQQREFAKRVEARKKETLA
jgi:hypothetical protein